MQNRAAHHQYTSAWDASAIGRMGFAHCTLSRGAPARTLVATPGRLQSHAPWPNQTPSQGTGGAECHPKVVSHRPNPISWSRAYNVIMSQTEMTRSPFCEIQTPQHSSAATSLPEWCRFHLVLSMSVGFGSLRRRKQMASPIG